MVYITRSTLGREINKYLQRLKVDIFRRIRFFVFIIHRLCNLLFCLSIQRYIWNVKQSWLSEYRYINLRLCQVNYFIKVMATELVTRRCWGKNSRTKPCCSKIIKLTRRAIARISRNFTLNSDNCLLSFYTLSVIEDICSYNVT